MNFYQSVFLGKNFLENIRKKVGFWVNYTLIFTLSNQNYDSKNYLKNLDYNATKVWNCKNI